MIDSKMIIVWLLFWIYLHKGIIGYAVDYAFMHRMNVSNIWIKIMLYHPLLSYYNIILLVCLNMFEYV